MYFYRKGRNATSKSIAGWYGPGRVVGVEKHGSHEENQTQGSIVWISYGTTLYRCAPEQLRKVTNQLQLMSDMVNEVNVFDEVRQAGNHRGFRDISQDLDNEPQDAEIHDVGPPDEIDSVAQNLESEIPLRRARFKQPQHGQPVQPRADQEVGGQSQLPGQGSPEPGSSVRETALPESDPHRTPGREDRHGEVPRKELPPCVPARDSLRGMAPATSREQSQIPEHLRAEPPSREGEGRAHDQPSGVSQQARDDFWKNAQLVTARERLGRDVQPSSGSPDHGRKLHGRDDEDLGQRSGRYPDEAGPAHHQSRSPADRHPEHAQHDPSSPADSSRPGREDLRTREASGQQQLRVHERGRSRSPLTKTNDSQNFHRVNHVHWNLETIHEEECNVGCAETPEELLRNRGSLYDVSKLRTGCLGSNIGSHSGNFGQTKAESRDQDPTVFFQQAIQGRHEVCEIHLDIAPRDVHQTKRNGVKEWKLNERPKRRAEIQFRNLEDQDKMSFLKAMQSETESYLSHEAIAIASRHGVPKDRILGMRWVLTWKPVENESGTITHHKPKARLIVKGFQDPDLLLLKRDSPTLPTQGRNLLLAISALNEWLVETGDIKTAFLNGDATEWIREIYADPPEEMKAMLGMKDNEIFRILKAVYGLLHAPRAWFDKLAASLETLNFKRSKLEPCLWRLYDPGTGELCGMVGGHVDDLLVCGKGSYFQEQIKALRNTFPFGSWKNAQQETIQFCGCELTQKSDRSIEVSQERYADSISEIPMTKERKSQVTELVTEAERKQFRMILGALSWRATQSAPWLSASVSYLQGCFNTATVEDLLQLNKLVRAQQQYSNTSLYFPSKIVDPVLVTFHDGSCSSRRDLSSQGGMITVITSRQALSGEVCPFAAISWQSKRLPRVCRSSTAAEIQTASCAIDHHEFLKQMFLEIMNEETIPVNHMDECLSSFESLIVTDSKNMYDSIVRIESSGLQLEEKRLAAEILSYRERLQHAGISCRWVDSDQQLADALSKAFHYEGFLKICQRKEISLWFDDTFTSAKKKRAMRRNPHFFVGS